MPTEVTQFNCTNQAGEFAEAAVTAELLRNGFEVLRPVSHSSRYDLGVLVGTRLIRLQIKLATLNNNVIKFYACTSKQGGRGIRKNYVGYCELIVGYCPITQAAYAIRPEDCPETAISLRITPTRQLAGIRMAEDFRLKAMIEAFATEGTNSTVDRMANLRWDRSSEPIILACAEGSRSGTAPAPNHNDSSQS